MSGPIFRPVCILMVIVDRKRGHLLEQTFARLSLNHTLCCLAEGTANHEILDYLGLDVSHKSVVAATVPSDEAQSIVHAIAQDMDLDRPGNGIAFTLPLSGIAGSLAMDIMTH